MMMPSPPGAFIVIAAVDPPDVKGSSDVNETAPIPGIADKRCRSSSIMTKRRSGAYSESGRVSLAVNMPDGS
jgi:hypothetical protein